LNFSSSRCWFFWWWHQSW